MTKVISFPNLAAPTGSVSVSVTTALESAAAMVGASAPSVRMMTKADRREYLKRVTTTWPCLSLTEGLNPTLRISSDNPPALLHGFAADYDNVGKRHITAELAELASRCAYPPACAGASLSGDGVHALWLFKEAIPVLGNADYARKVMAVCYSKLRVSNFMQGFDEGFKKPDRLLSVDPEALGWLTALGESCLVDEISTRMWASSVTQDFKFDGPALDLQKVYEKIQQLFPGRWPGAFDIGARGPRFWDSSSTDNTAAVVTASGMVYFSDGGGFKPWASILGNDVASKLSAESLGELTDNWFYDSTNGEYILEDKPTGTYATKNRSQFFDRCELAGLDDDLDRKRAIVYVEDHKKVTAIVKLANQKRGLIQQGNQRYINATDTQPITPAPGDCHFIVDMLKAMFGPEQIDYFLGWIQESVECVMEARPSYAQAVFMAGAVESGKSLLQFRIITPLLGGRWCDPMPALLGETGFNSELAASGSWIVSDQEGAKNAKQRSSFTQKVKAVCANPGWAVNAKFKEPCTLFLNCRLTFSFNKTDDSLSVIPRLGDDILGKLMLFNVYAHGFFKGLNRKKIEATIEQELPAFAHWLLNDYVAPDSVKSCGRYRIKSYHSPELLSYAKACQDSSELLGWLQILFTQSDELKSEYLNKNIPADFTAARWLQIITQLCGSHFSLSPNKLSAHFQNLAKQFPDSIKARLDIHKKLYSFSVDYNKLTETK